MAAHPQAPAAKGLRDLPAEELFPERWLRNEHLQGRIHRVAIERATIEEVCDEITRTKTPKICIWFHRAKRGLLLNKTQTLALLDVTGAKTVRGAVGAQIILRPETYRGKLTIAIEALPVQPESD